MKNNKFVGLFLRSIKNVSLIALYVRSYCVYLDVGRVFKHLHSCLHVMFEACGYIALVEYNCPLLEIFLWFTELVHFQKFFQNSFGG